MEEKEEGERREKVKKIFLIFAIILIIVFLIVASIQFMSSDKSVPTKLLIDGISFTVYGEWEIVDQSMEEMRILSGGDKGTVTIIVTSKNDTEIIEKINKYGISKSINNIDGYFFQDNEYFTYNFAFQKNEKIIVYSVSPHGDYNLIFSQIKYNGYIL